MSLSGSVVIKDPFTPEQIEAIRSDAVHWKLDVLYKSAGYIGEMVAIRLDLTSERRLWASREASKGSLEFSVAGTTWRGLPFVLEGVGLTGDFVEVADAKQVAVSTDEPEILTIEIKDRRTGRTVYLNWDKNPEGYR